MKRFSFLLIFSFLYPFFLFADTSVEWARLEAENLPAEWNDWQDRIAGRPWVVAEFVEKRHFHFRIRPVELEGTVWYGRKEGLTLIYREPQEEVIRVDRSGVRQILPDGETRERDIPERGREIPNMLLAMFHLDFTELEKTFQIEGRRDDDEWGLRLTPLEPDEVPVQMIELAGERDEVHRIVLEQTSRRRIELELSDPAYPSRLDEEALDRVFP